MDERIKRLERQLDLRQTLKIPGVSAAIVKDQKLLWAKGIGFADVENKIPAAPGTSTSPWRYILPSSGSASAADRSPRVTSSLTPPTIVG